LTDDSVVIPAGCPHAGRPLSDLSGARDLGVLVCGIQHGSERTVLPPATATFEAGDRLLLMGATRQLALFKSWLAGEAKGISG